MLRNPAVLHLLGRLRREHALTSEHDELLRVFDGDGSLEVPTEEGGDVEACLDGRLELPFHHVPLFPVVVVLVRAE